MFVIGAKLGSFALQSAYAAGGYFFRFAGKSNQKGATSLEEAIFFYTGTAVSAKQTVPVPATYCGVPSERLHCAAHRGEACRGVGDSGKAVSCRELPSGANQKDATATIAAALLRGNAVRVPTRRVLSWRWDANSRRGCVHRRHWALSL
jgi:hypothetical protein